MKTKNYLLLFTAMTIFIMTGCKKEPDVTVTLSSDKTSLTLGETVTLTATISSDKYECTQWSIDYPDGTIDLEEINNSGTTATWTITPNVKGTSIIKVGVCNKCSNFEKSALCEFDEINIMVN